MPLDLSSKCAYIKNIQIYENEKHFYFIGTHNINKTLLIFTIKKISFDCNSKEYAALKLSDIIVEYKKEYDQEGFKDLADNLSKEPSTNLRYVEDAKCIFGFFKLYLGYYAILVSETTKIGKIGVYVVNRVEKVKYLPLFLFDHGKNNSIYESESRYLAIFKNFDISKQTYFSYAYDMTKTLQRNFVENLKNEILVDYDMNFKKEYEWGRLQNQEKQYDIKKTSNNFFLWNHFHIKEFYRILENKIWVCNFIYGFFEQIECNIYGLRFLVSVIARRNRYYAGTRYLKRGINDDGNVANDVETEQILEEISTSCIDKPNISSFIHIRGSVPIYWHQDQYSIIPKPDIKLNQTDILFEATKRHFYLLTKRYGYPNIVCNLTKKKEAGKPQETLLNEWYSAGVEFINSTSTLDEKEKIIYYHYDLKSERRQPKFYRQYYEVSCSLIEKINMFCFIPHLRNNNTYLLSLQNGVIRSNCVDCLDRTNVYQQVIGTAVMVLQLRQMGIKAVEPNNEYDEIYGILTEIYKKMGHELSSQYAGSLAHKQTIKDNRSAVNKFIDKFPELFNTCKRYFNNSFNDQHKQATINLFLGKYKFNQGLPHIWELTSDASLHQKEKLAKLDE